MQRAVYVGILILAAYSMLIYSLTQHRFLGMITDLISGLSVIFIPVLLYPLFHTAGNKSLNYGYLVSRFIEDTLMIAGGIMILSPSLEPYRELIYIHIHIYFFISGALFFYILLYRTRIIPAFISVWGIIAVLLLFFITILKLFDIRSAPLDALLAPMIINEVFLAIWLIFKGFQPRKTIPE